ncbi:hypothetical protein PF006_g20104 [Phytophthora fragariae]|uniref:Uncharacterized protein n=1 Tax=Phytophthora fragariae TaxID=53985 RepID=A0A6A3S8B3_9STRA|nr:hypothetical protein PF006_g20104 [Phytophthora fragariae]
MANRSVNAVDIRLIVVLLLEREADRLIQQRQVRLDAGWGVNQRSRRALLRQRLRRHLRVCFSWETAGPHPDQGVSRSVGGQDSSDAASNEAADGDVEMDDAGASFGDPADLLGRLSTPGDVDLAARAD